MHRLSYSCDRALGAVKNNLLSCLDREALSTAGNYTKKHKSLPYPFKHARRLGKSNTEALINGLKNQSTQQNLASALASTKQILLISTRKEGDDGLEEG